MGHAPKVLPEYCDLIKDAYDISIYAPAPITSELSRDLCGDVTTLPHHIVMKGHPPLTDRMLNKIRMFLNIRRILNTSKADVIWFFNVEFYLFLYLALFGNNGRKIVVTLFLDGYHTGKLAPLKQRIFEAGQRRVARCISTGSPFSFRNMPYSFIPDYVCDDEAYGKYRIGERRELAVCLGTMDHGKQLEELVDAFSRISYPLLIAGRFYDKDRLSALRAGATENIEIRDAYLTDEEYMELLGSAAYAVLPYNEKNYASQTSGVMQEALFTDTIVLTHEDILSGNKIPGVGYGAYGDITDDLLDNRKNDERNRQILDEYATLRRTVYGKESIRRNIINSLSV